VRGSVQGRCDYKVAGVFIVCSLLQYLCVCVYYCSTYYKAVRVGGVVGVCVCYCRTWYKAVCVGGGGDMGGKQWRTDCVCLLLQYLNSTYYKAYYICVFITAVPVCMPNTKLFVCVCVCVCVYYCRT
jgi:hypothetical protein